MSPVGKNDTFPFKLMGWGRRLVTGLNCHLSGIVYPLWSGHFLFGLDCLVWP